MRSTKIDRRELIFAVGGTVVAIAGVGIYCAMTGIHQEQQQEEVAAQTVTVQLGEIASIDRNGAPWDGTMEITLERSSWYESYEEAAATENLGDVTNYANTKGGPYVVCEFTIHSADAISSFETEGQLNISFLCLLMSDGMTTVLAESVYSNAPMIESDSSEIYVLELQKGDTITATLGYPLPEGTSQDNLSVTIPGANLRFELDFTD